MNDIVQLMVSNDNVKGLIKAASRSHPTTGGRSDEDEWMFVTLKDIKHMVNVARLLVAAGGRGPRIWHFVAWRRHVSPVQDVNGFR